MTGKLELMTISMRVTIVIAALAATGCSVCLSSAELSARKSQLARTEEQAIQRAFTERGWTEIKTPSSSRFRRLPEVEEKAGHGWSWIASTGESDGTADPSPRLGKQLHYGQRPDRVVQTRDGTFLTVTVIRRTVDEETILWCECDPGRGAPPPPTLQTFAVPSRDAYGGHRTVTIETTALVVKEKKQTPGVCHAAP